MTRIILTRHGETLWNLEGRVQGALDSPLTNKGIRQAQILAERLMAERISAVYSSDLLRAMATADEIRKKLNLPEIFLSADLRELSFGEWEGKVWWDLRQNYPELFKIWDQGPHEVQIPGGESMQEVTERAWNFFLSLSAKHPNETICVVTHGMTLQLLVKKALGIAIEDWVNVPWQHNTALNILELNLNGEVTPVLIADHQHLEREELKSESGFIKKSEV